MEKLRMSAIHTQLSRMPGAASLNVASISATTCRMVAGPSLLRERAGQV